MTTRNAKIAQGEASRLVDGRDNASRDARRHERERHDLGPDDDEEDHGVRPDGLEQALAQHAPTETAVEAGDGERPGRPHAGGLRRGHHAGVDPPEDQDDQGQHGRHLEEAARTGAPGGDRAGAGSQAGPQASLDRQEGHEAKRQHHARNDPGGEEPPDRFAHRRPVDDQGNGRRDEDAEGAPGGDGARGDAHVVAACPHLGDRNRADGSSGRDARSAQGGEDAAGDYVRLGEAARHAGEPRREPAVEARAGPAVHDDGAHEQKEGDGSEDEALDGVPDHGFDPGQERRVNEHEAHHADDTESDGDPYPAEEEEGHDRQVEDADNLPAHDRWPKAWPSWTSSCRNRSANPTGATAWMGASGR